MNISKKSPFVLLSFFILPFLVFGCAHENTPPSEGGVTYTNPIVTMGESDFYALHLSGENMLKPRPKVEASGKLFMKVNEDQTKMYFTLYVDSLKNITEATINYGTKTYDGPVIVTLYPARHTLADSLIGRTYTGMLGAGTLTEPYLDEGALTDKQISDLVRVIKHDSAYVQIDTKYLRDGAIRAQIKVK